MPYLKKIPYKILLMIGALYALTKAPAMARKRYAYTYFTVGSVIENKIPLLCYEKASGNIVAPRQVIIPKFSNFLVLRSDAVKIEILHNDRSYFYFLSTNGWDVLNVFRFIC